MTSAATLEDRKQDHHKERYCQPGWENQGHRPGISYSDYGIAVECLHMPGMTRVVKRP